MIEDETRFTGASKNKFGFTKYGNEPKRTKNTHLPRLCLEVKKLKRSIFKTIYDSMWWRLFAAPGLVNVALVFFLLHDVDIETFYTLDGMDLYHQLH